LTFSTYRSGYRTAEEDTAEVAFEEEEEQVVVLVALVVVVDGVVAADVTCRSYLPSLYLSEMGYRSRSAVEATEETGESAEYE
jgi:hypothetical protein